MIAFSTATIPTMVVFTSLNLVALALGLLVRRYSAPAFGFGLAGLLALTIASTLITYIGPESAEMAARNRELQSSREQIRELKKRIEADQADLATAQDRLRDAQQEVAKAKAESEFEQRVAVLQVEQTKLEHAKRNEASAIAKIAELEKRLSAAVGNLSRLLDSRLDTPFYTSEPLEQRALVAGLTGSWYVMRLKLGNKPFVFADGRFRMPEAVPEVKGSAHELKNGVLALVGQMAKSTRLFLRGGADPRRLVRATDAPDTRELLILPRLPDGNYAMAPRRLIPAVPVHNEDLPNLRADWLRQQIRSVLLPTPGSADIEILDNPPAPGHERTVDLILFAEW